MVRCWGTCVLLSNLAGLRSVGCAFPITAELPTRDIEVVGVFTGPVVWIPMPQRGFPTVTVWVSTRVLRTDRFWRNAGIRRSAGVESATIGRSHKDALCAVDRGGVLPPDWRAAQLHSMDA